MRTKFSAVVAAILLTVLVGLSVAAPDPNSMQVQGPPTIGNPLPVCILAPGATSATQTQLLGTQTGANQVNTATLTGAAGVTTYLTGFSATAAGATAGLDVTITTT